MSRADRLEACVGRCFMVGYLGSAPDPELAGLLERDEIGAVILFTRNAGDGPEIAAQIARLRELGPGVLVALDQEGGPVLRVTAGASDWPSAMALGQIGDPELAGRIGEGVGREMVAMGADLDLAPVVDVNRLEANPGIGIRSFATAARAVSPLAVAWAEGLARGGALGCAKHFPGKGGAAVDAHVGLPVVGGSRGELSRLDLPPFRALVRSGVASLMTSHVIYPALDPVLPVTFSPAGVAVARSIGFSGAVLSDDLEMGALAEFGGAEEDRGLRAIAAGHDMVLVCHRRELHLAMVERIVRAVRSGELPEERVREAEARVAVLRAAAQGAGRRRGTPGRDLAGLVKRHAPLVAETHRRAVRVLRGRPRLDAGTGYRVLVPDLDGLTLVEEGTGRCERLVAELRAGLPEARFETFRPKEPRVEVSPDEPVLVFSYNAHLLPAQGAWLTALAERPGWTGVVALRNPFDLRLVPGARLAVATLGYRRGAQVAVARVLLGEEEPGGRLRLPRRA